MRVFLYANSDATLMPVASVLHRTGNKAYEYAFPVYRLAYRIFKAYTDRAERQLFEKDFVSRRGRSGCGGEYRYLFPVPVTSCWFKWSRP